MSITFWAPSCNQPAIRHGLAQTHGCAYSVQIQFLRVQDPDKFCESVEAEQQALRDKLVAATSRLPEVAISADTKLKISEVPPCSDAMQDQTHHAAIKPEAPASHVPERHGAASLHAALAAGRELAADCS